MTLKERLKLLIEKFKEHERDKIEFVLDQNKIDWTKDHKGNYILFVTIKGEKNKREITCVNLSEIKGVLRYYVY
jgi:hypothetical protein